MSSPKEKTFFFIAGEPSGDILGASLIRALQAQLPDPFMVCGIGGPEMEQAGHFTSFFPLEELSHMGLWEILPHIPHLFKRLRETTARVLALNPTALITLDAPEFSLRVAQRVAAANPLIPRIHVVAPSVWALRPKRAKKIARFLDHLLALLPFEPPYFEKEGLPCTFVGHPLLEFSKGSKAAFYDHFPQLDPTKPLLCLLPGSRRNEIERHLPIFAQTVENLRQALPHLQVVLPTVPPVAPLVHQGLSLFKPPAPFLLLESHRRFDAFAAADVALAASGTVALELAFHDTPLVIAYQVSKLTEMIARRLIRVSHVCLLNLLLDKTAVPECLQKDCNPERLTTEVLALLTQQKARENQQQDMCQALELLQADQPFSQKSAHIIQHICEKVSP